MRARRATALLSALLLLALSVPTAAFAHQHGGGDDGYGDDAMADDDGDDGEAGEERPLLWDVPEGFVHEPGIRWVAEQGITTGFEDGSFRPGEPVTRGQMATFLDRALELEPGEETFPDVPEDFVHAAAISAVAAAGITTGFEDGTFRPADDVTRGQMATFLQRALDPDAPTPPVDPEVPETPDTPEAPEPPETPVVPELPETPETPIALGSTALGEVLVDAQGMTLYIFDNDVPGSGESTCTGGCADNWPPLTVEGTPQAGEGLDEDLLGVILREDGSLQVTYNGWPLYTWVNDDEPGDTTGQGVNDVWWVIGADGTPLRDADEDELPGPPDAPGPPARDVLLRATELGEVLVDAQGMTLYIFDNDEPGSGESVCVGPCAENWPPLVVEEAPRGGPRINGALLGTIEREDGSLQVTYNGWPLYTWVNDDEPGDTTGQGVNDVWWVIGADGTPLRDD